MALGSCHRLLCGSVFLWAACGMVPEPRNLRVHSVMLESVLQWDPPDFHKGNVTYRVQHMKKFDKMFTDLLVCEITEATECDISDIPIYVPSTLRVRTEFQNNQSNWVFITFTPIVDTKISPPALQVEASQAGALSVQLTEPYFIRDGRPLRHYYSSVVYRIHIWKKDYGGKQVRQVNTSFTFEIIPGLDPGTTYCLKAQAFIEQFNKNGEWSEPLCDKTNATYTGINRMLLFLIVPSGLIVFICCCYMIFRIYQYVKYAFFPSYFLPLHFKEFLDKPSYNSYFVPSQIQGDDYTYEKITVLSEELKNGGQESDKQTNISEQGCHLCGGRGGQLHPYSVL